MAISGDQTIQTGLEKGIIHVNHDHKIITYPNGKSYNFEDPEELIRAAIFIELVDKYGYPPARLDTEVYPPRREPKIPADIVVYEDNEAETAYIVVETKADATKDNTDIAHRQGLGNANLLNSKFLYIVCGNERFAYDVQKKPSLKTLQKWSIARIPEKYGQVPQYRYLRGDPKWDLRKLGFGELSNKFKLCHDAIWEGGRRDPAIAFDEISKMLLIKIHDEWFTHQDSYYDFQIGTYETDTDVARRLKTIYDKFRDKEPEVFVKDIEIPNYVIFRLVEILQDVSLKNTDLDAKGRAFEKFLGRLFRGEYGQYFTPRQVVEFMVSLINPTEAENMIDPACGSGGFLLYSWMHVKNRIQDVYKGDDRTISRIDSDFSRKQLYGIENNDRIARVAMMDMAIHEDGRSNIECNDALSDYSHFDPKKDVRRNKFDIILTNPPFGYDVTKKDVLGRFDLGKNRKSQRTEVLFLERCHELLKPSSRIGIVIPNSVLSNTRDLYVRRFILEHYHIDAIIGTPFETFKSSGVNVRSSLLFLRKKSTDHKIQKQDVYFARANYVGYDNSGKDIKQNDFPTILQHYRKDFVPEKFVSTKPSYVKIQLARSGMPGSTAMIRTESPTYNRSAF
jgi:type I restriction enzyme M protein